VEKLPGNRPVTLDRCGRQPLIIPKMLPILGRQIVSRCGLDTARRAYGATAQELQQLHHLEAFTAAGLGANALVSTPTATLVPLDVCVPKISQHHTTLRDPTVKSQCVRYFDIDDARRVLLIDQRCHKRAKVTCKWTGGATSERRDILICVFHDASLRAEVPGKEGRAMSSTLSVNAQQTSSIVHNGT
jgi:hypothetical protein